MSTQDEKYVLVLQAIDLIAKGLSKTRACDQVGVSVLTFNNFVKNDDMLGEMYAEADEVGADTLADILLEIDSHPLYGQSDAKMATVISKNIQWYLSKRKSGKYGDKLVVEHNITADKAVIEALQRGRQRALEGRSPAMLTGPIEDAVVISVVSSDDDEQRALAELF